VIRIQYAVFLENIDFDQAGRPTFKSPVTNLATRDISAPLVLQFPLFVTFIEGSPGIHQLHIDIIGPSGGINSLPDFEFDWSEGKVSHGEVFAIKFEPDAIGLYIFRLTVDGEASSEIPLPVIQQQ